MAARKRMKRVLIIDDDAVAASVYRNFLQKAGFEVSLAHDGAAGLASARANPPDALLLDLMLPKMPGIDVLKGLRSDAALQNMPVVAYTNAFVEKMVQDAMEAGATHVFNKATLTPTEITEAFRRIFLAVAA